MDFMLALSELIRAAYVGRVMEAYVQPDFPRPRLNLGDIRLRRAAHWHGLIVAGDFRQCSMGDEAVAAAARRNREIPHGRTIKSC